MIGQDRIVEIARDVASANLTPQAVSSVASEPTIESDGGDGLRITIVVPEDLIDDLRGEDVLRTLVQIQDRLQRAGEERFAVIRYATLAAENEGGGSES